MTDDLIAHLSVDNMPRSVKDIFDALEAKDKRIAELEAGVRVIITDFNALCDKKDARIAALEEALEEQHRHHLKLELRCRELEAEKQAFKDGNKHD